MFASDFHTWSLLHLSTVAVCAGLGAVAPVLAQRSACERARQRIRLAIGWGCLVAWAVNTAYWMAPARFDLGSSLPIHFCNVANIFGALAVLRKIRLFQGVIYFWAGLYVWAFLTPTVGVGPAHLGFWVFWIYHLFIALALVQVVVIDRFRPSFRDLLRSCGFTLAYVALLVLVDHFAGWNYGFLGDAEPNAPTPVDMLGPYPIRIVWMVLLGAVVFFVLWLPFRRSLPSTQLRPS